MKNKQIKNAVSQMGLTKTDKINYSLTLGSISHRVTEWISYRTGKALWKCEITQKAMKRALLEAGFRCELGRYDRPYFNLDTLSLIRLRC